MDETRLAEVFRAAVADAPPAGFDGADVRAESARLAGRARERAKLGAALAGVVALIGVGVAAGLTSEPTSQPGQLAEAPLSGNGTGGPGSVPHEAAPTDPSRQERGSTGTAAPKSEYSRQGCGAADRELASALADELPAVSGAEASSADLGCPVGARGVRFQVSDGTNSGVLEVVLVPATAPADPATGRLPLVAPSDDKGAAAVTATTRAGGAMTLVSKPATGSTGAPFAEQLSDIAARLAARY
ncbi:MAG: hypothetical protein JOZ47_13035 [Kutzneria sp.]|nr:hypothetical protein [Kutzneria sp.]MBV9845982.1 hypothetical protein [Kutzneria sp.]